MTLLTKIPMFTYLLIFLNVLALGGNTHVGLQPGLSLETLAFKLSLPAREALDFEVGDLLLIVGIVFLYIEIFKATRASRDSILDHMLSLFIFIAFLLEFLLTAHGNSVTFFLLMLMSLLDVIAGFTISISAGSREVNLNRGG